MLNRAIAFDNSKVIGFAAASFGSSKERERHLRVGVGNNLVIICEN
jgi:hypothetical protein